MTHNKILYGLFFPLVFAAALLFSLGNSQTTDINFLIGTVRLPLALALTLELLAGVLIGVVVQFPTLLRLKSTNAKLHHSLLIAESEIRVLRERLPKQAD